MERLNHQIAMMRDRLFQALDRRRFQRLNGGVEINGMRHDTTPEARERLLWAIQALPKPDDGAMAIAAAIRNHMVATEEAYRDHRLRIEAILAKRTKPENKLKGLEGYDVNAGW